MKEKRRNYSASQKVSIMRELLEDNLRLKKNDGDY
jgi:hypothetical protein